MKLHWSPRSPFVRKVDIVLLESGLDAQVQRVRTVVAMTKPNISLLPDNPLGKLPTLVLDDGTPLYDSSVISEYLSTLAGNSLVPRTGSERLLALRREALGDGFMDLLLLYRHERSEPAARQDPALMKAFPMKVAAVLKQLDEQAEALAQPPFDIGHIAIGCSLSYLDYRFEDLDWRQGHERIAAWHAVFAQRPSVLQTTPSDDS